ncbi:MAG: hypothetical protein DRQ35_03050 [Gammaproteobacteria bacterium]|nr:MAG: hypothetical protein DRQ35_03050 [Gammaproteobacteria bacterium]
MGGKSAPEAPPPVQPPAMDMESMMMMMSSMMGGLSGMTPPGVPELPEAPEIERTPEIDWKERNAQLQAKMKGEQFSDNAARKGRTDTIHTSPLLDEQPDVAEVASSLLTETA